MSTFIFAFLGTWEKKLKLLVCLFFKQFRTNSFIEVKGTQRHWCCRTFRADGRNQGGTRTLILSLWNQLAKRHTWRQIKPSAYAAVNKWRAVVLKQRILLIWSAGSSVSCSWCPGGINCSGPWHFNEGQEEQGAERWGHVVQLSARVSATPPTRA